MMPILRKIWGFFKKAKTEETSGVLNPKLVAFLNSLKIDTQRVGKCYLLARLSLAHSYSREMAKNLQYLYLFLGLDAFFEMQKKQIKLYSILLRRDGKVLSSLPASLVIQGSTQKRKYIVVAVPRQGKEKVRIEEAYIIIFPAFGSPFGYVVLIERETRKNLHL